MCASSAAGAALPPRDQTRRPVLVLTKRLLPLVRFPIRALGGGEHDGVAFVDDMEFGRATVRVTTLGVEFLRDVAGECEVADFPLRGETVTLEWQQRSQNFVITDVECRRGRPPASSIQLGNHHPPGRLSSALNMSMTADLAA